MENILQTVKQFLEFSDEKLEELKKKNQTLNFKRMKRKGIQVSKRFLLLLLVPILFIGSQAASVEQSESSQTIAHPSELYFSSIPANPNIYRKISVFSDPQLKKAKGEILPNTPFTIEQLFVNDEGKAVFKIADKGYVLADSSVIFF